MLFYFFTILSSIFMALSLSLQNMWLLGLVSLVPYLYILFNHELSPKKGFKLGLTYGFSFFFVLLHWILSMYPLDRYGLSNSTSILVLLLGWIFLSLFCGFWLAFVPYIFLKYDNKGFKGILLISSLWIVVEYTQQIGILGFPWGRIALSQLDFTPMVQSASLFGSLFISFLVIIINCLITKIIISVKNKNKCKTELIILSCILFLNLSYGFYSINNTSKQDNIQIAIIQGNLSSNEKWGPNSLHTILNTYVNLSIEANNKAISLDKKLDYIIWPETTIPITLKENSEVLDSYKKLAKDTDTTLIVGAYDEIDDKSYNAIYAVSPNGNLSKPYYKRKLVPFGEFLPFENFLSKAIPFLNNINLFEGNIFPGEEASLISTVDDKIGGLICFESIFPRLTRDIVKEGAELIVIGTNDSWFKNSNGLTQHLRHSRLRAVESNRYIARSANTGISALINPNGTISSSLGALEEGYILDEASLITKNTLYTKIGDLIILFSLITIIYLFIEKSRKA